MMVADVERYTTALDSLDQRRNQNGVDYGNRTYVQVKDRLEVFRLSFGFEYGIETEVDYSHGFKRGSMIVAKAKIVDFSNGHVVASGHSMEWVGNGDIGTTAPIEACETAAIGRALACFGLAGGEYASANEMEAIPRKQNSGRNVLSQQELPPDPDERVFVNQNPVNQNRAPVNNSPKPPSMPDFCYVPPNDGPVWDNPGEIYQGIMDTLDKIDSVSMLGKYWSSLEMVKQRWGSENPEWLAELKDNFTKRSTEVGKGN